MNDDNQIKNSQGQPDTPPQDALAEYRNEQGEFDPKKIEQLANDKKYYRSQIAKLRQLPQKVEEYGKDFVLDSKFDEYVSKDENKERINKIFEKLDKLSLEKGLGVDKNHDMRRFVLDELVAAGAIDLTPESEKTAKLQQAISERNESVKKAVGETIDIDAWNNGVLEWLRGFCNSEAEYKLHENLVKTNATWALSLNKVRHALMGNRIPVAQSDPKYNEAEWQRTFAKADRETQDRMLEERAKILTKDK